MVYQKKKTKGTKKTKGRKHLTQKQKQHVSQRVVVNVSVPQRKPPRKMGSNAPKQVKPSMTSFYGEAWHLQRPASNVYDNMFRNLDSKHKDTDRGSKRAHQGLEARTSGQRNEMETQTVEATRPPAAPLEESGKLPPIVELESIVEEGSSSVADTPPTKVIPEHKRFTPPTNRLGSGTPAGTVSPEAKKKRNKNRTMTRSETTTLGTPVFSTTKKKLSKKKQAKSVERLHEGSPTTRGSPKTNPLLNRRQN
jgi:hypothetical protein